MDEATGGTVCCLSAKHAWSKSPNISWGSIARLFNMKRVITPWNVEFFCFARASPEVTQFSGFFPHLYEAG
jgi:hypothetical protein